MSQEYKIQSIAISRSAMTQAQAIKWVTDHFGNPKKIDVTATEYRFRQRSPIVLRRSGFIHYYTKQLPNGVHLIIAHK